MDQAERQRTQLGCLYDMFRDRIEENVIYLIYSENEGQIEQTIDQLMSISACSLTGHYFEPGQSATQLMQDEATEVQEFNVGSNISIKDCNPLDDDFKTVRRGRRANTCLSKNKKRSQQKITDNRPQSDTSSSVTTGESNEQEILEEEIDLENDNDKGLDLTSRIEGLQSSIDDLLAEKGMCHEKASHYLGKKMFPVTSYYSELASQYGRGIENKTKELVDLLLMKSENSGSIDLHGLTPIQAKLVVTELLRNRQDKLPIDKQGEVSVDIITGWGKHTVAEGNHRIRPTIISLLRERGYEYCHLNRGALRVKVRRLSGR